MFVFEKACQLFQAVLHLLRHRSRARPPASSSWPASAALSAIRRSHSASCDCGSAVPADAQRPPRQRLCSCRQSVHWDRQGWSSLFSAPRLALPAAKCTLMAGHECYHCKQWVEQGEPHDCWSTTEAALTRHLSDDLREAWERLREKAASFGEQRIYASHHSIMFSRKTCYFFVRPKENISSCVSSWDGGSKLPRCGA